MRMRPITSPVTRPQKAPCKGNKNKIGVFRKDEKLIWVDHNYPTCFLHWESRMAHLEHKLTRARKRCKCTCLLAGCCFLWSWNFISPGHYCLLWPKFKFTVNFILYINFKNCDLFYRINRTMANVKQFAELILSSFDRSVKLLTTKSVYFLWEVSGVGNMCPLFPWSRCYV